MSENMTTKEAFPKMCKADARVMDCYLLGVSSRATKLQAGAQTTEKGGV